MRKTSSQQRPRKREGGEIEAVRDAAAAALARRPEIRVAFLYGSAIAGGPFRDVDIGVVVDRATVPAAADLDYAFGLADELVALAGYPVDVQVLNDAPLALRYNASQGEVLVARSAAEVADYREQAWDEYLDFLPVALDYLREMS